MQVTVEEAIISQSYEITALVSGLEKKGILSRAEIIEEIKKMRKIEKELSQKRRRIESFYSHIDDCSR